MRHRSLRLVVLGGGLLTALALAAVAVAIFAGGAGGNKTIVE